MCKKLTFYHNATPNFVSVIIPVYNDAIGLRTLLPLLRQQTLAADCYEIVVANDGSNEDISVICREYDAHEIKITPRRGSYYARNRALEQAHGAFIAFTDADALPLLDWLEKGVAALQTADYVAGLIKIDKAQVKTLAHYYEYKTAFPVEEYMRTKHFGPTANLFVRRKVFEEVGGFDERLISGGDLEFGDRIWRTQKNLKQCLNSSLIVLHPPRSLHEIIRKIERVTIGSRQQSFFYPMTYSYDRLLQIVRTGIFLSSIRNWRLVFGDSPFNPVLSYGFCCLMKFMWFYFRLKWYFKSPPITRNKLRVNGDDNFCRT